MEDREIIVEPHEGQWIAFYPRERYNRVTAATPEAARALLGEMYGGAPRRHSPIPMRGIYLTAAILLIVGVAAASLSMKDTTSQANHAKWAHHQHHKHQR